MTLGNWIGLGQFILLWIGYLAGGCIVYAIWGKIYFYLDKRYWDKKEAQLQKDMKTTNYLYEMLCTKK